ncbi:MULTISPECIES: hypothetical protein [Leptospira]|uniref:hypothetical protein n=1 Tax=Leptospira TaxID=171 RepID=UPI0002DB2283|nr:MULTISPECIES: hypothetical protein [Leptospira]
MEEPIHAQFLVDEKGEKASALLPIEEYNAILNNAHKLEEFNAMLLYYIMTSFQNAGKPLEEFQKAVEKILKSRDFIQHSVNLEYQKIIFKVLEEIYSQGFNFSESDEEEPTKEEIFEGIKQGFKEAKLIQEGKLEAKSMKQLLDEL